MTRDELTVLRYLELRDRNYEGALDREPAVMARKSLLDSGLVESDRTTIKLTKKGKILLQHVIDKIRGDSEKLSKG